MGKKLIKKINTLKNCNRFRYIFIATILLIFISVIGFSLSLFTNNNSKPIANIKVNDLSFNITTNTGESDDRILRLQVGKTETFNIVLTNLNNINARYELLYDVCSDQNCSIILDELPYKINLGISSGNNIGVIAKNEQTSLKIMTQNNSDADCYIKLKINAGYEWNDLILENQITNFHLITNVKVYTDDTETKSYPTACNYDTEIKNVNGTSETLVSDVVLTCDRSTKKWTLTYDTIYANLILRFSYYPVSNIYFHVPTDAYFNGISKNSTGVYSIEFIRSGIAFNSLLNSYSAYKRSLRPKYNFKGWNTSSSGTSVEYTSDTTTLIYGDLNLYAIWESDTVGPSCSISIGSTLVPSVSDSISGVKSQGWSTGNNSFSVGKHIYTATDYAENTTSCGVEINDIIKTTKTCTRCAQYASNNPGFCIRNETYDCSTIACASGYTRYESTDYCYKYI